MVFDGGATPLTAAGPSRIRTGFPYRVPFGRPYHGAYAEPRGLLSLWLPVIVWAAVIFTFSSIPSLTTGLGTWDLILRKGAHMTEYAILGLLLLRALGRELPALAVGIAYAITDELHQHFVRGRHASPIDVLIDTVGLTHRHLRRQPSAADTAGAWHRTGPMKPVAIELDVLGDTRPLWNDWLADAARRFRSISPLDPAALPEDRAAAAEELDAWAEHGVGDWRAALGRFAEDRAPVYLRPDAEISAALRELAARGDRLGVFTDAPEALARIAVAQLGADRRIEALETGSRRARAPAGRARPGRSRRPGALRPPLTIGAMRENEVGDRQLDALLERLDRMNAELHALNRRLDSGEHLAPIVYEIRALGESLQALAYAALGQTAPQVRRRRTG